MSRVVVVGGGLSGAASAVRLSKLGHQVTLLERNDRIGGALIPIEHEGFTWALTGDAFTLPATLRDLFKKSGRPLDKELELIEHPVLREHRFADRTRVALPGQSRTGVVDALDALSPGLAARWLDWTDSYAETWELLRRHVLERRYVEDYAPSSLNKLLHRRTNLARTTKPLRDPRLRELAHFHAHAGGHQLAATPAWFGVLSHVEQTFGSWAVPGGPTQMVALLEKRLNERGVDVRTRTTVTDVTTGKAWVGPEVIDADAIVVASNPRALPSLAPYVARAQEAQPPELHLLAVEDADPRLPHQIVLHLANGLVTIDTTGPGPAPDKAAWTVSVRGQLDLDLHQLLASHDLTQASTTVRRISGEEQVARLGGSPYGIQWEGAKTQRLGVQTPVPGVFAAGAHTTVSPLAPFVVLSSALIAAEFDTVPRVAG